MSYSARDNLCEDCRREQQIGILGDREYKVCRECLSNQQDRDAALRENADDREREDRRLAAAPDRL